MEDSNDAAEATTSTQPQKCAPAHELPTTHFYSIEYPGYVRPESASKPIHTLGGQSSIDRAFRRSALREDSLLELNLRPDNPFSHPLLGNLVPTNNILLRVVKRKHKRLRHLVTATTVVRGFSFKANPMSIVTTVIDERTSTSAA